MAARDIKYLEKVSSVKNIKNFTLSYNRHHNKYQSPTKNFPEQYEYQHNPYEYDNDPDYSKKFKFERFNVLRWSLFIGGLAYYCSWRLSAVNRFDAMKRQE